MNRLIDARPGRLKRHPAGNIFRKWERRKSSVRCKVEHVFARVKPQTGYRKVRHRGLRKEAGCINALLAQGNPFTWECWERQMAGQVRP